MVKYSKYTREKEVLDDFFNKSTAQLQKIARTSSSKNEREAAKLLLKWEQDGKAIKKKAKARRANPWSFF